MTATSFSGVIYLHMSPSGKVYVGQTTHSIKKRWRDKVRVARCLTLEGYDYPVSKAIRKYGPKSFTHQTVTTAQSKDDLNNLEKCWIILLRSRDSLCGYNVAEGGNGNPGLKHTYATKEKIRLVNLGRKHTAEAKENMGASHRGFKHSPGTIAKMTGQKRTPQQIQNIQNGISPEGRERVRQAAASRPRDAKGHFIKFNREKI